MKIYENKMVRFKVSVVPTVVLYYYTLCNVVFDHGDLMERFASNSVTVCSTMNVGLVPNNQNLD